MKADKEFIEYMEKRYKSAKENEEKNEPNGEERFKHIYHMGESSAFKELLAILS